MTKTDAERASDLLFHYPSKTAMAKSLGVSRSTIYRWLKGEVKQPRKENVQKIKRREYYYNEERPKQIKTTTGTKNGLSDESFDVVEARRVVENEGIKSFLNDEAIKSKKIDFVLNVIDSAGNEETRIHTFRTTAKSISDSTMISFLYKLFRISYEENVSMFITDAKF